MDDSLGSNRRSVALTQAGFAADRAETHARHELVGPPYSLDDVLHLSRYRWVVENLVANDDALLDLGCGSGFGAAVLAEACASVVGVDIDPGVAALNGGIAPGTATFLCANAATPALLSAIGGRVFDVIVSMETIEHIEDYFSYIENAVALMRSDGAFVVGTPNRRMTYEWYPGRRHMDPSHVQEFTPVALTRTLEQYFGVVDLHYQVVPGHRKTNKVVADENRGWHGPARRCLEGWIPPKVAGCARRIRRRAVLPAEPAGFELSDVAFVEASDATSRTSLDAFALIAVCRQPIV